MLNDDVTFSSAPPEPRHLNPSPDGRDIIEELEKATPFTKRELLNFRRYRIVINRVSNMTIKGKLGSFYALVVAGDGKGLVGYGEGGDVMLPRALDKAFAQAVKNMDWVNRKEDRTVWGVRRGKFGATRVELRERPSGFGLRTSPVIHRIAQAAGIEDLSAKIHGSRNPMNTTKLVLSLLQGGSGPVGMGDGFGHRGRREDKGVGMRSAEEIAQTLGRRSIDRSEVYFKALDKRRANY